MTGRRIEKVDKICVKKRFWAFLLEAVFLYGKPGPKKAGVSILIFCIFLFSFFLSSLIYPKKNSTTVRSTILFLSSLFLFLKKSARAKKLNPPLR
jgi:hypothetical protein